MTSNRYQLVGPVLGFHQLGIPVQQGTIRSFGKGQPSVHGNAAKLKPWRAQVQAAAEEAIALQAADRPDLSFPLQGPVGVGTYFTRKKPTSAPKTRTTFPTAAPDLDKLIRAILDSLKPAGVYLDDAQVVWIESKKVYPMEDVHALHVPGVLIEVFEVISVPLPEIQSTQGEPSP